MTKGERSYTRPNSLGWPPQTDTHAESVFLSPGSPIERNNDPTSQPVAFLPWKPTSLQSVRAETRASSSRRCCHRVLRRIPFPIIYWTMQIPPYKFHRMRHRSFSLLSAFDQLSSSTLASRNQPCRFYSSCLWTFPTIFRRECRWSRNWSWLVVYGPFPKSYRYYH